jgi:apolipoprotein D and lipocalin family protein
MTMRTLFLSLISMNLLAGCSSSKMPPLDPVAEVDIDRFMGDWYVIASIPTSIEKSAFNAVESYRLDSDGTIATTFSFRKGDQGRLQDRLPGRELQHHGHRPEQAGLRLDHGAQPAGAG